MQTKIKNAPSVWEGKTGTYVSHNSRTITLSVDSKDDGGTCNYIVTLPHAMVEKDFLEKVLQTQ